MSNYRKFVIGVECLGLAMIMFEAGYLLLADHNTFHFVGYMGAGFSVLGGMLYAKFPRFVR